MMNTAPTYQLKLQKTYYDKGFFNLGVEIERFVRRDSGPICIQLGASRAEIKGTVNRQANQNGTPRIMGGAELRNWFHRSLKELDLVNVVVLAPDKLWIDPPRD
jgi:hypothetical protein